MTGALLLNIGLMYAILIAVNVPAPFLGLNFDNNEASSRLAWEPPGFVIPLVWFVLFTLLGVARHELGLRGQGQGAITVLAVLCATYAYYTLGLAKLTGISALWFGLAGNLVVIAAAAAIAYGLRTVSATAAYLVVPVAVWTAYATTIVLGQMKQQKLI